MLPLRPQAGQETAVRILDHPANDINHPARLRRNHPAGQFLMG
jgi:hypothetical protein